MRNAIVAMTMALTLVTGQLRAAAHKTPPAGVGPGRIAWFDVTTTNDQAAEIVAGGIAVGTLRIAEGKISTFNGVVYVQVTDIQASCKKVNQLGGTVVAGFPFNLPDGAGAVAVVVDPVGHPIGLYSRSSLPPAPSPTK